METTHHTLLKSESMYQQLAEVFPQDARFLRTYINILFRLDKVEMAHKNLEKLHGLFLGLGEDDEVRELEERYAFLKNLEIRTAAIDPSFLFFLDDDTLNKVVMKLKERTLVQDEYLFSTGDKGTSMFLIMEGSLTVLESASKDHPPVIINFMSRGDIVGELAMYQHDERTADVIATKPCRLFELKREDLISILDGSEEMAKLFKAQLDMRYRMTFISRNPMFSKLPLHARRRIAENSELISSKAGEVICQKQSDINDIRLLISGSARTLVEGGAEPPTAIQPGDIIGEVDMLSGVHYASDIVAMTDVDWISIPLELLQNIRNLCPQT
ncbi:MAG: hypothetical protein AUJ56_06980 [Zetaproteobacteria bacterium CG1_02_49_23]|nr:MAG: hypothetical protein AUJ56_06980 [Zetaproteobacteria bacterium CG1_02_49_23]